MTDKEMAPLFALLAAMPSKQDWSPGHRQLYSIVLAPWSVELGQQVIAEAARLEEWRPAPAILRQIAARLMAPYPDANAVYAEIMHKAETIGLYGRPDQRRPATVFEEGAPAMSHPLVAQVVAHLGGWRAICTGEAQRQEGLRKQVDSVHEGLACKWEQAVLAQMDLPEGERDPSLFRPYAPYQLPPGYMPPVEGERLLLLEAEADDLVEMPEPVMRQLIEAGFDRIGGKSREAGVA